ncbi:MAG: hypothetical protein RXP97_00145 [Nitrososphaeria archaeon]|jgi:hypothetical protein
MTAVVKVDKEVSLDRFRKFLILSTCKTFIPEEYERDFLVFPERYGEKGVIYVEAADKYTLDKIRDITFARVRDVLGIIYESKSGNTSLRWRQIRGKIGRVSGQASTNALVNLIAAGVIEEEDVKGPRGGAEGSDSGGKEKQPESESEREPDSRPIYRLEYRRMLMGQYRYVLDRDIGGDGQG